jgi:hypothetical protein
MAENLYTSLLSSKASKLRQVENLHGVSMYFKERYGSKSPAISVISGQRRRRT